MTIKSISPFLWFNSQAEDAANFYVSLFPDSRITQVSHSKGSVMAVGFELFGQRLTALNGGPHFTLNEAFSLLVDCTEQADIDRLWAKLCEGGAPSRCGWVKDRFGLSWQVNYAGLADLASGPKGDKVMGAMMGMTKIDVQALKDAAL